MTTQIDSQLVDRLYRLASRLREEWANVPLRDDFETSMIVAVVQTLERVGHKRKSGLPRTATEQIAFAEALLRAYWKQSAARDYKRHVKRRDMGWVPVSLDEIGDIKGSSTLYGAAGDDVLAGATGREVAHFLDGRGWPREQAWAMVFWLTERSWDDIAYLLDARFEVSLPTETVRQWQKKFARMLPEVARFLRGADEFADAHDSAGGPTGKSIRLASAAKGRERGIIAMEARQNADCNHNEDKRPMNGTGGHNMKNYVGSIATIGIQRQSLSVLAVAAIGLAITGCHTSSCSGRTLIGGLDGSMSWHGNLGQGVLCLAAQAQTMDARFDAIHVYRVDRTTAEFAGEDALDDPDRFQAEVIHQMQSRPKVNGTYPVKFWRCAANMAGTSKQDCLLELFSDADNDDESAETRADLKSIGRRLAANQRVSGVWFFGISPDNRAYWRDLFGALGDRLHFCSPGEMTPEHAVEALSPQ